MKLNAFPPALIRYSDDLPEGVGGHAQGPVITIRQKYADDEGIHAHEFEHVRQWWMTLTLHSPLYLFVRRYRLWAEASAYRVQMEHPDRNGKLLMLDEAAERLCAPIYKLNITHREAIAALMNV